jgi:hypothetical protein
VGSFVVHAMMARVGVIDRTERAVMIGAAPASTGAATWGPEGVLTTGAVMESAAPHASKGS